METGFTPLRVAAISMRPQKWNKEANADSMERLLREAASKDADVALTPEGALEGMVMMDAVERRRSADRLLEISEPRDGPYVKRFSSLAKELRMCLCIGYAERAGDSAYNSATFIDHDGTIRGTYRKMQFAEGYHDSWFFSRLGRRIRAFDTPHGRAGLQICNDRWSAALSRALVLDGAQVIYIPAYGSRRPRQDRAVLARARENGVPVVEANVGVSLIVSKGEIVARERGLNKVTVATIDVPTPRSSRAARRMELEFLAARPSRMKELYIETMAGIRERRKKGAVDS